MISFFRKINKRKYLNLFAFGPVLKRLQIVILALITNRGGDYSNTEQTREQWTWCELAE